VNQPHASRLAEFSPTVAWLLTTWKPTALPTIGFERTRVLRYFLKNRDENRGMQILWGQGTWRADSTNRRRSPRSAAYRVRRTGYETFTFNESDTQPSRAPQSLDGRKRPILRRNGPTRAPRARRARRCTRYYKKPSRTVSTFLSLRGAQVIAESRIADPKDRERFLALVREAMRSRSKNGEPLPSVALANRAVSRTPTSREPRAEARRADAVSATRLPRARGCHRGWHDVRVVEDRPWSALQRDRWTR